MGERSGEGETNRQNNRIREQEKRGFLIKEKRRTRGREEQEEEKSSNTPYHKTNACAKGQSLQATSCPADALRPRFPNWGTRSGSGGTREENFRDNGKRTEFAECTL